MQKDIVRESSSLDTDPCGADGGQSAGRSSSVPCAPAMKPLATPVTWVLVLLMPGLILSRCKRRRNTREQASDVRSAHAAFRTYPQEVFFTRCDRPGAGPLHVYSLRPLPGLPHPFRRRGPSPEHDRRVRMDGSSLVFASRYTSMARESYAQSIYWGTMT